jgi:hypothetical protein
MQFLKHLNRQYRKPIPATQITDSLFAQRERISSAPKAENQSRKSEGVPQHCLPEVRVLDYA